MPKEKGKDKVSIGYSTDVSLEADTINLMEVKATSSMGAPIKATSIFDNNKQTAVFALKRRFDKTNDPARTNY